MHCLARFCAVTAILGVMSAAEAADIKWQDQWALFGYATEMTYLNGRLVFIDYNIRTFEVAPDGTLLHPVVDNTVRPDPAFRGTFSALADAGDRFWILGGDNNAPVPNHLSSTVLTGTIASDGTVSTLTRLRDLPYPMYGGMALALNNKLYILGGYGRSAFHYAEIAPDGSLGDWVELLSYPTDIHNGGFVALNGYLYANGANDPNWGRGTDKMYFCKLDESGMPGAWERTDPPTETAQGPLLTHENKLYFLDTVGGMIYCAEPGEDGDFDSWEMVGELPTRSANYPAAAAVPGGFFVAGGFYQEEGETKLCKAAFVPWESR